MIASSDMALGIGLRAAIMARGQKPRVIMAALRPIPRLYHGSSTAHNGRSIMA